MAKYQITSLNSIVLTDNQYIYKDLALDLKMVADTGNQFFKNDKGTDLKADVDYVAVRNSLFNLFNCNPGERLLDPTFGLGLKRFLFQPCSKQYGMLIGDAIKTGILQWEPRVSVVQIGVVADPDNYEYQITLVIVVPSLQNSVPKSTTTTLAGVLSNSGFKYIS